MPYEVRLTDRAARDLDDAYRWYERSPEAAAAWYKGFIETLDTLSENPRRCSSAPESSKFSVEIRQILYGKRRTYRALYAVQGGEVVVLHIRHTARRELREDELEQL